MVTLHQLFFIKKRQKKTKKVTTLIQLLKGKPQKKAICLRLYKQAPKKPNSAQRAVAKVRLCSGQILVAAIGGEGHKLQEHSIVLVRGGRSKDLPAVRYHLVRGAYDLTGVVSRKQRRSKYGTALRKRRK